MGFDNRWVEFDAVALRESDSGLALLCEIEVGSEKLQEWFPLSQISDASEVRKARDVGVLIVSRWICLKKDWFEEEG